MYKKIFYIFILFIIIFTPVVLSTEDDDVGFSDEELVQQIQEASTKAIDTPNINSRSAVIMDRTTGVVIYEKNLNQVRKMASTTKVMTAIVVIEHANLDDIVTVSKKAGGTGGSTMGLKANDKVTVKDLLYGLMLPSGNDAAVALAEHVGGNLEGFARIMNEKAKELGLKSSNFVTPHGLDEESHYTTAYELAQMTNYALNMPLFAQIVKTEAHSVRINEYSKELRNTNELLGYLDGVYGVKTGFTNGANRCLVSSIKRGNLDLICIVLGADTKKDRTRDSISLIEYTYKNYKLEKIEDIINDNFNNWKNINEKRIVIDKGVYSSPELVLENIPYKEYPLKNGDTNRLEFKFSNTEFREAPISKNEVFGKMDVELDGKILFSINVINKKEIEKKKVNNYFFQIFTTIPTYISQ